MRYLNNLYQNIPLQYRKQYFDLVYKYLGTRPLLPTYIVVAVNDNEVVGGISGNKVYYCLAIVQYLVVHERYRNKGIGTKLLQIIEDILRNEGINVVILTVNPKKTKPGFYAKRGYRILSMFKNKYGREVICFYKTL